MRFNVTILAILLCLLLVKPAHSGLTPQDVVVVYNNSSIGDWTASKSVAEYYCLVRGISPDNMLGVDWPHGGDVTDPGEFVEHIEMPLRSFLTSRPGFDPNDLTSDPTQVIVLCYGIPLKIRGNERAGSVDSALALMFNSAPWGQEPLGSYSTVTSGEGHFVVTNPYCTGSIPGESGSYDPANRTKPADFEDFRASTYNNINQSPPKFRIIRMLDDSHALAGGYNGMLYRGIRMQDTWNWTPIEDRYKGFISHVINDIFVLDSSHAWVCTEAGTLLQTDDGGVTWRVMLMAWIDYVINSPIRGISFYGPKDGWIVGIEGTWGSPTPYRPYVAKYHAGAKSVVWGDLPSDLKPAFISGTDAQNAWVSGNSGIWHTMDGGQHWTQQYSASVGRIWVKDGAGWAITSNGSILYTTDGVSWSILPDAPGLSTATADMSVFDANHLAIAYGVNQCWLYDNGRWINSICNAPISSIAWVGTGHVLSSGAQESAIYAGSGAPDLLAWNKSFATPYANWKLRYLVCRLDGYVSPEDNITGIPVDIKNIIDKAAHADKAGRNAVADGRYVLDDDSGGRRVYQTSMINALGRIAGSANIYHEPDRAKYATNQDNVIGYSSGGSYDNAAHNFTTWWRPMNAWKDGALGIFWLVSTDCRTLGYPYYVDNIKQDSTAEPGKLKISYPIFTNQYDKHWVGLYLGSAPPSPPASPIMLARAYFNNGIATMDLAGIVWPQDNVNAYIEIHFPDDDRYHSQPGSGGDLIARMSLGRAIYDARVGGISYTIASAQSLAAELIRDGCTGTTGNVYEPFASACPDPEIIFPQYATGRTWAESAYMGLPALGWMEVVVGDPLMAPYKVEPSVEFTAPTPADGARVGGSVILSANAASYGNGRIRRVDFWVKSSDGHICRQVNTDNTAPFMCLWSTQKGAYPDGNYTIEAVAYQYGDMVGWASVSRNVVIDNAGLPGVSIVQPSADGAAVNDAMDIKAQPDGVPTYVQMWLYNDDNFVLVGEDPSEPYLFRISKTLAPDGVYQLQAAAYYDSAGAVSFSAPRKIMFVNNAPVVNSVAELALLPDGTNVYLANAAVTAGTSAAMDGAFYVEDNNRAQGIRIEGAENVSEGRLVGVRGVLRSAGVLERHMDAAQVWDFGPVEAIRPLGISCSALGGSAPSGIPGGVGAYNVGLLVRIWGRVIYEGSDFVYIDDMSGASDSSALAGPVSVPLDNNPIPSTGASIKGVRVYYGSIDKPGIGDYVSVTGISSVKMIGGIPARLLRVRRQDDTSYALQYKRCLRAGYSTDGSLLPPGSMVRVVDAYTYGNWGSYLEAAIQDPSGLPWAVSILGNTQLTGHNERITVIGTLLNHSPILTIRADAIYLGEP